jgi:outer membrane biogenesis lipoprotein LolB
MKALIAALLICACSATRETFPTNTANEKLWKQEYRDGKISWSQYQAKLKTEKK